MAGLVVAQLLLEGRAVMLEIAPAGSLPGSNNRQFYRMKLTGESSPSETSPWPHTRPAAPSIHCWRMVY